MNSQATLAALSLAIGLLAADGASAQSKLTAQDYIDIEQLTNAYPDKIDNCTNSGYDYADQYTPTAVFGVSSQWGSGAKIWYRGRDELADAGGGGKGGCRPKMGGPGHHHVATSLVITPTATGAHGKSTLLSLSGGTADNPPTIEWQGGYEDTYVKTAKGWRFASRLHVWPGYEWSDTAAEQYAKMAKARAAAKP